MRAATLKFRLASWLAIAAMALNALWPLLANARPAAPQSLFEICTTAGIQPAGAAGQPPGSGEQGGERHLKPHCALCGTGIDKAPAAAGAPGWSVGAAACGAAPVASAAHPAAAYPHSTPAQPRAPPRLS